jgi:hypothetical protein
MRVFKGELKKTSGGLTKQDLIRNKRGKVVSRKKSGQASGANNLGDWLRRKGESYQGVPDRVEPKKVKTPKIMVHKPKPKPQAKAKPQAHKHKPKSGALKKVALKPPRRKKSPVKVGQKAPGKKHKISVSNIISDKIDTKGWPGWAKKQPNWLQVWIQKQKKKMDWDDLKEEAEEEWEDDDEFVK